MKGSLKEKRKYYQNLYNTAYLRGYEDCQRDIAKSSFKGARGYHDGFRDKQKVIRITNKVSKLKGKN